MLKRFVSLIGVYALSILLLFSFPHISQANDSITFTTWYSQTEGLDVLEEIIVEMTKKVLPDVSVDVAHFPGHEYVSKLQVMFAGGVQPELMQLAHSHLPHLHPLGGLANMNDYNVAELADNLIPPELFHPLTYGGELLGVPLIAELGGMFVNLTMFEEAGLAPPDFDWDWNDFLEASRRLTRDLDGDGWTDRWGTTVPLDPSQWLSYLFSNGGSFLNESQTEARIDSPESVQAIEWLQQLVFEHEVARVGNGYLEWVAGDAAIGTGGTWLIRHTTEAIDNAFEWDFIPVPRSPHTGERAARLLMIGMAVGKDNPNLMDAIRIAQESSSIEVQQSLMNGGVTSVPVRMDLMQHPDFYPTDQVPRSARRTIVDAFTNGYALPEEHLPHPSIGGHIVEAYHGIMMNGWNVQVALTQAAEAINGLLRGTQ